MNNLLYIFMCPLTVFLEESHQSQSGHLFWFFCPPSHLRQPLVWAVKIVPGFWVSLLSVYISHIRFLGISSPCGLWVLLSWPGNSWLQGRQGSRHRTHVLTVWCQDCRIPRERDIVISLFDGKQLLGTCLPVSHPVPDEAEIKKKQASTFEEQTEWLDNGIDMKHCIHT